MGDVSGGYYDFSANNVFRVNPDGEIVDTFKKLTFVFREEEKKFFEKVSGVVFGKFICKPADKLQQYIKEFAVELGLPAYVDFPIGHVPQNYSIDFTRTVEIKNGEVTFPAVYDKK